MPSVITYDRDAALRQGIAGAGSALSNALMYNAQQKQAEQQRKKLAFEQEEKYKNYGTILQETIGS